ncbi:polymerase delta-interacting protein 3 [Hyla sarda]|uniref:polymerase delta-interacting protein 3 n=1 Tax=Hyla sarda TaxID=327740 RepID=UPI0024C41D5D|nr:polymerase delta-interacting protein 3 [Hyla sarda]
MADVSLDELIRKRGMAAGTGTYSRVSNRGAMGGMGGMRSWVQPTAINHIPAPSFQRTFDARQKIGVTDARLKLGMKDAREKLVAKDARFRIKGKVQDAREMLNSKKQQVGFVGKPTKLMDAREKISLKRSAPAVTMNSAMAQRSPSINITKTIQISQPKTISQGLGNSVKGMRINVVNHQPGKQASPPQAMDDDGMDDELELSHIPTKQMKIIAAHTVQKRPGLSGNVFSLGQTLPLTKVVQNDAYTALVSQPPASVAPPLHTKNLTSVSRTLVTKEANTPVQPAPTESVFSPLEGTKMTVNNLHPRVTEEDIVELFCVCGALKRARLLSPGVAEVVFVRKEDAVGAYKKYNNRYLDGQPMKCNLHLNGSVITSDQPILLRLSDTPSAAKKEGESRRNATSSSSAASTPAAEVDPDTILKALFKSSGSSAIVQPTAFKIKL